MQLTDKKEEKKGEVYISFGQKEETKAEVRTSTGTHFVILVQCISTKVGTGTGHQQPCNQYF